MKNIFLLMLLVISNITTAQEDEVIINVNNNKTVYIVFKDYPLVKWAKSEELMIDVDEKTMMILAKNTNINDINVLVKAGIKYYPITFHFSDKVKTFYNSETDPLFTKGLEEKKDTFVDIEMKNEIEDTKADEDSISKYFSERTKFVTEQKSNISTIGAVKYKYLVYVSNMYIDDNYIYIKYNFKNNSNVKYNLNYSDFLVNNKTGVTKKTGEQPIPKKPILPPNIKVVEPKSEESMILIFSKFTIDKKKTFDIEVWEKDGDRRVSISIGSKDLINLEPLNFNP